MFQPQSFGSGPFTIHVEVVGGNAIAASNAIKDLPSGTSGTQNTLENSLSLNFTTAFTPGQQVNSTIFEGFEDNLKQDTGFLPRFEQAEWNQALPPLTNSGQLRGLQINGAPFPVTSLGTGNGKRTQTQFTPNGQIPNPPGACGTPLCLFNAPFDTNVQNIGVNPNGGSHLQLMYLSNNTEVPQNKGSSIELLEWGTTSNVASPVTYPGFRMLMGHTSFDATTMTSIGLTNIYSSNFEFNNPQNDFLNPTAHPDPTNMNPLESPITVIPPTTYAVANFTLAGQFIPYPFLNLVFDFDDNPWSSTRSAPKWRRTSSSTSTFRRRSSR
jgi:hypothetical protein